SKTFTDVLQNGCQSITAWNLSLDEKGRPNIGPFPCGGVVTIDSNTKEITRAGQFWAFAQFSRFIKRGAKRFSSQGTVDGFGHVAVENSDGRRVVVLANTGAARVASVKLGDKVAEVPMTENSVTTLVWS